MSNQKITDELITIAVEHAAKDDTSLKKLLNFDALDAAEKITGDSYKIDEGTEALGIGMFFLNNEIKDKALKARDDTTFSNKVDNYTRILLEEGFEKALELPFTGTGWGNTVTRPETFFIYWHPAGILLKFDTYNTDSVNSATMYYQTLPKEGFERSSCHWEDGVLVGNHDAREALRYKLRNLHERSELLPVWKCKDLVWLLHYMDTKDANGKTLEYGQYDYKAIARSRLALLPEHVREAIKAAFVD